MVIVQLVIEKITVNPDNSQRKEREGIIFYDLLAPLLEKN